MNGNGTTHESSADEIPKLRGSLAEAERRARELQCLCDIARLAHSIELSVEQILTELVDLIPTAGQAPEEISVRIVVGSDEFRSRNFPMGTRTETKTISLHDEPVGRLEVSHDHADGNDTISSPFLEEVKLLEAVAETIGFLLAYKRTRDSLLKGEGASRALFQDSKDLMFVKDTSGKYTDVNPAVETLLGIPASRIIGMTSREIFGKEVGNHIDQLDHRVMAGESVEHIQTRTVRGVELTFHDKRIPLRDDSGRIVGSFCTSRNITELTSSMPPAPSEARPGRYPSKAMRECLEQAEIAAATNSIILLLGESGCGKDHLARWIHEHSNRAPGPFFAINCAALPHELAESELFGHEPGAYTGARAQKKGLLELAEGGTLLLNEIGELPLSLQSKLLTFLDIRSFLRVGGEKNITVNARLLAATHRDLNREITEGRFLEPLFYRLNVFPIKVPALRERPEDIPLIAREIMKELVDEMQIHDVRYFDSTTLSALAQYDWPGNVRELRNVLERSLMISSHGKLSLGPLIPKGGKPLENWSLISSFPESGNLRSAKAEFMKAICEEAVRRSGGNRTTAAKLLGISRNALYRYLAIQTARYEHPLQH